MTTTTTPQQPAAAGAAPGPGKLPRISYFGYAAGDMANNLAFTTATMFLLVYYTDVAGISAAAAGTLFLVARIFDAFTDVWAGRVVDKTYTRRWGKFRPFILFGAFPLLALTFATFHVPQIGESGMLLYAYVTYIALGLAYTFVNIPYGSLAAAMTQVPAERAKLASARTIGAAVTGGFLGIFVAPMLTADRDLQQVFTNVTLLFVVVGCALYFFTFMTAKERVERDVEHVSMRQSLANLKGNKPLLMLCVSTLLLLTGMITSSTASIYFLRDVFQSLHLYPVVAGSQLVLMLVVAPFVPKVVRRFGKRSAYIAGGVIGATGSTIAFLAPTVWIALAGNILGMFGILFVSIVIWALEADTVEYGEWKTGVRTEGTTYAIFSFTRKAGQALGGALGAYALAVGGYVAGAEVQSTAAEWGIRAAAGLIPALLTLAAALVMLAYPLTDDLHARIVAEIKDRRAAAGDRASHDPHTSTAALATEDPQPPFAGTDTK
ncbi:glucuronide transporter [Demequina maris]|uniref:glucuronide transporter n=1 Tax=Demequina maris TaxID=1638982 RepID=UPI0009E55B9F|nr:glucuronide transporter [Demequina maris]